MAKQLCYKRQRVLRLPQLAGKAYGTSKMNKPALPAWLTNFLISLLFM